MKYLFLAFIIVKLLSCLLTIKFSEKYRKYVIFFNLVSTLLCACIIWIFSDFSILKASPITICLVAYEIVLQLIMLVIYLYTKNEK